MLRPERVGVLAALAPGDGVVADADVDGAVDPVELDGGSSSEHAPTVSTSASRVAAGASRMPPLCEIAWQHACMPSPRRAAALLVLAVLGVLGVATAGPAAAHERAVASLVSPAEGAVVTGDVVEVV